MYLRTVLGSRPRRRAIAETDINLAPLEPGNPFCEAKSELKFFEAAIVGVPTIASATEPFAAAIEDGVSGLLATDTQGWRRALDLLVTSEDRRRAIGAIAARAYQLLARIRHRIPAPVIKLLAATVFRPATGMTRCTRDTGCHS